jgi:hypothetical protein
MGNGKRIPTPEAIYYAQRIRRMDGDYGWVNCDKLHKVAQYVAVVDDLDFWRVLEFAELWYLLNQHTPPSVDDVRQIMKDRPTLFMYGIDFAKEVYESIYIGE